MTDNYFTIQQFTRRVFIVVGIVLATYLLLNLIYYTIDVLLLFFGAVLLAIFLRGLADLVTRQVKISEGLAVLLVSVVLLLILSVSIALLAPSVADQFTLLREKLPKSAEAVSAYVSQFGWGRTIIARLPSITDVMAKLEVSTVLTRVGGYFSSTVGALGNFLLVILLAIYLATEPRFYARGFAKLFPIERRDRVYEVLSAIGETLSWWLIGKAGSMLFIGVLTWIGLSIIGVPLALALGLLAGVLSFIPNFGPILSAVPAILFAFIGRPIDAVYVLGLYVGVQLIESNLVTPIIERETVELPPALTIVSQIALGILLGFLGLVLATPLLAMVMVLVQMVYIEDILGDKQTEVNENQGEDRIERKGERLQAEAESADRG